MARAAAHRDVAAKETSPGHAPMSHTQLLPASGPPASASRFPARNHPFCANRPSCSHVHAALRPRCAGLLIPGVARISSRAQCTLVADLPQGTGQSKLTRVRPSAVQARAARAHALIRERELESPALDRSAMSARVESWFKVRVCRYMCTLPAWRGRVRVLRGRTAFPVR